MENGVPQLSTKITEMLGIRYPVFQGGMAWVADASIASAVSNAGGLGIIGCGPWDIDTIQAQVRACKEKTDKPFGLNIMLMSEYVDDIMQMVLDEDIRVITTGAGNPGKYIPRLKERDIKVIPVAGSVAIAKRVAKVGADAVIAEGLESGGHLGEITTMALVPQVVDAVDIPVIAAGGIADGRGIAAAYMLGAQGVQVGTRFLVANECIVAQGYKDAIIKAKDSSTVATGRSTGHPVRIIKNKLARKILSLEKQNAPEEEINQLCTGTLAAAVRDGDSDNGNIMSGQIAGLVKKEQPAAEIIEEMFKEVEEIYEDRNRICRAGRTV